MTALTFKGSAAVARSERFAAAFALAICAASIGFGIGRFGLVGFLVFQGYLPFMLLAAGPGAALMAWSLSVYMEKRAATAADRGELWRVALLIAMPPALLNIAPALAILSLLPEGLPTPGFRENLLPYILGGLWGGLGLVTGTLHGLQPGRTT